MRPISSVALAFLAGTANPLILATASPLSERQQNDTITVRTRVSLHPAQVDILEDADYALWSVDEESSSSFGTNGLNFTLSTGDEAVALQGDWHKFVYRKTLPSLGERLVGTGISTHEDSDGGAVTLTIVGLPEGEHSLLTWHNSFVKGDEFAQISISVDGSEATSDISQSSEVNNIWDAATSYVTFATGESGTIEITFTPSGADNRVYLNGFEIDGPDIGYQVGFPEPENKHEHIEVEGGSITASWRTPRDTESATYDIYLGTDPDSLESVASGVSETQVELSGLNTQDTFYWRVDVTADAKHYPGRAFMFRLAQLAFPGAEGYGRFARGGRGGKVVHVTTLEDGEQEGTLRWALTGVTGPRTVVFDVGGVITTTSRLSVNSPYVTVAGQTAPGKGIAVQGHPLGLTGAQDVVFRHVRVRPGIISGETIDGMGMQGSNYCIFDRCSMGWAIDECFSSRSAHNITFQRSMISEPLNVAGHQNYPEGTAHGYSATIGGDIGSFHHNLLAHAEGRSWSMGGGADDNGAFAGQLDIRNNVVYNFGTRVTDGGAHKVDFVGNYYKPGPSSERTFALEATYEDGLPGTQQYHCAGNSMLGIFDQESEQYPPGDGTSQSENIACYAKVSIDPPPDYQAFFDEPFFDSYVETQTSTEAYKRVLSDSGASQPILDDHDRRIIQETLNGTTTYTGSKSGKEGLIDSPDDARGLEDFPTVTRSASWDADGDGIADWWDGSTGGEGYTALDGYLNFMAEPHAFVEPSGSVTVNLAALAAGFESPSFALSEASLGSVSVDGSEATFKASGEAGVDRLEITIKDGEGTWTRPFGVAVFEGADDAQ